MKETFKEFCARILPIVKAGAEGMPIEVTGDKKQWIPVNDDCGAIRKKVTYRIAEPKATPLPITPEMWAMIDPKYKFACMDAGRVICFSTTAPEWGKWCWVDLNSPMSFRCESPLSIDTAGIIPELSLAKRPDVLINNKEDVYGANGLAQKQFVRSYARKAGGGAYSDDELKQLMKSVMDGRKDGIKAALKEFSEANGTDYLVIEHRNPITGVTQTMRFKIK